MCDSIVSWPTVTEEQEKSGQLHALQRYGKIITEKLQKTTNSPTLTQLFLKLCQLLPPFYYMALGAIRLATLLKLNFLLILKEKTKSEQIDHEKTSLAPKKKQSRQFQLQMPGI